MREYWVYTIDISHPKFGKVTVEVDEMDVHNMMGWWRQKDTFNLAVLPSTGKWFRGSNMLSLDSGISSDVRQIKLDGFFAQVVGERGTGRSYDRTYPGTVSYLPPTEVTWQLTKWQKMQELTIQDIAKDTVDSEWKFVGSMGGSVGGGPGVFGIGINGGKLFVKGSSEPDGKQHELLYTTAGGSIGKSLLPVTISGASASMPSGGIGKIRTKKTPFSLLDFEGLCAIVEVSGFATGLTDKNISGGGLYAIFFFGEMKGQIRPFTVLDAQARGFMWGTLQGVGVTGGIAASIGSAVVLN